MTSGLNAVVRSLTLGPGDEVLLGDAEYGGMERLWEFVRRRTGATVERRPFAELGVLLVVDGAHAPGQLDLDLEALGADVYSGNCHKWLCAPKGSGFLYARPAAQRLIDPMIVSWDWLDDASFPDLHRWQGTRDPSAYLAVPAAIAFQAEHDWPAVRRRCHDLLASLDVPFEPLADEYVQCAGSGWSIPIPRVSSAGWVMRVSVQAYNDEDDLAALARALS